MACDYDLFVIGAGSGGVRCARIAAGHGARVGIAEELHWGGTCVNVGCVPKKIMVQGAEYGAWAEDARGFGWSGPPPVHDWAALAAARDREVSRLRGTYRRLLESSGVAVHETRATLAPEPHALMVGGRRVTAERIVVAVGGRPVVQPGIEGAVLGIVSDQAFELRELPRRVVMVGGGYIGVEFAGIFRGLGAEVDLVMRQDLPLRGFDHELRAMLADGLRARGIRLHPNELVHRVEAPGGEAGGVRRAHLRSGGMLDADLVFFAVGRVPHTEGLGLEAAGVETNDKGAIRVDSGFRTTRPDIFAIGDVCDRINLTPVAIAEGHHLADRLFGSGPPRTWNFDAVPSAVFSSPPIAAVGPTEHEAAARAARGEAGPADIYATGFTPMRHAISGRQAARSFMKLVVDRDSDRVLGAHMIGDDAPEMVQGLAVAITAGARKRDLDRTIGIHPTAAEEWVTMRARTREAGA